MTDILNVSKMHASIGKIPVLQGVNLRVAEGETVALLGRNGVGKTSTLRSILGLLSRTGGSVHYNGHDISKTPAHKLAAEGIGYVPQGRGIFPRLTVEENLYLGLKHSPSAELKDEIFQRFPRLQRAALTGGRHIVRRRTANARPVPLPCHAAEAHSHG